MVVVLNNQATAVPRDSLSTDSKVASAASPSQVIDNNLGADIHHQAEISLNIKDPSNQDISHSNLLMVDHNRPLVSQVPQLDKHLSSQVTAKSQNSLPIIDTVAHQLLNTVEDPHTSNLSQLLSRDTVSQATTLSLRLLLQSLLPKTFGAHLKQLSLLKQLPLLSLLFQTHGANPKQHLQLNPKSQTHGAYHKQLPLPSLLLVTFGVLLKLLLKQHQHQHLPPHPRLLKSQLRKSSMILGEPKLSHNQLTSQSIIASLWPSLASQPQPHPHLEVASIPNLVVLIMVHPTLATLRASVLQLTTPQKLLLAMPKRTMLWRHLILIKASRPAGKDLDSTRMLLVTSRPAMALYKTKL